MIGVSSKQGITDLRIGQKESFEKYKIVRPGDFIYNTMRINIGSIAIYEGSENALTSPDYVVFRVSRYLSSQLLLNFLKSEQGLLEIGTNTKGSVRARLYFTALSEVRMPIAPLKIQELAEDFLNVFSSNLSTLNNTIGVKLEQLSKSILNKAFKGEFSEQLETDGDAKVLLEEIAALKGEGKKEKVILKKYVQPDEDVLRIVAEESPSYPTLSARDKKVQRKMLATHIINQSLEDKSFGKTKFEKLLHLVECHVLQKDLNQNYSVQAAGPYDGGFTKTFWDEVLKSKWFAIQQQGTLRRIVGGESQSKSVKEYGYFSDEEKQKINDFIKIFDHTNYERPEIVSTLYAVWNNRIKRNEPINDELLKEDFLNWDSAKAKYADRLDKALEWMREKGVVPNGWGKEIKRVKK